MAPKHVLSAVEVPKKLSTFVRVVEQDLGYLKEQFRYTDSYNLSLSQDI